MVITPVCSCLEIKQGTWITWSKFNRYEWLYLVNFRPASTGKDAVTHEFATGNMEHVILPVLGGVFLFRKKFEKIGQAKRVRRLCDYAVGRFANRRLSTECGQANLSTATGVICGDFKQDKYIYMIKRRKD